MNIYAANPPEKIPSKLIEVQATGWYAEQVQSWKKHIAEHPDDKSGWLEYYKAAEYAGLSSQELEKLAQQISENFPDSFEANYVIFKQLGWQNAGVAALKNALQKATKSKSLAANLQAEKMMLAELQLDNMSRSAIAQNIFDSKTIHTSLLNYSYNVLMSVGHNGILVVDGEAATIPIWMLQDVMGIRRDIKILNLDLAENTAYLSEWLKNNQLKSKEAEKSITIIKNLPELNPEKEFYYALTLSRNQLHSIEDRLYVVGLASIHKNSNFDNYSTLKENIESKFLIDYLTVDFNGEPKTATGRIYESNYILPFLLLKEYYDKTGNNKASERWQELILSLADRSQIKNRVSMLLNKKPGKPLQSFKKVELDIKELDKKLVKIKGNLYASTSEVNNKDYWFYLDYLFKNGYKELYEKSATDLSKYDDLTATLLTNYHYTPENYAASKISKSPMAKNLEFPAMDMSHEAAKAYCEWLTVQYNQQSNRKYKKVQFRLPTQKEWTMAALGAKDFTSWNLEENTIEALKDPENSRKETAKYSLAEYSVLYPWWQWGIEYGQSIQNQKGCYLANVKVPEDITCPAGIKGDGYTMMSYVGAYFSNGLGLYDVIGNVGEMIDIPNKAMGGSWNHTAEKCTITSVNAYDNADSSVGFRIFMEVIEE